LRIGDWVIAALIERLKGCGVIAIRQSAINEAIPQ
jgi:hypothetical protein